MIELRMLGSIDLHDGRGRSIRSVVQQPKRLALLAYLAAQPSAFPSRDTLIGLFWPELDNRHARASLRQTLYYLRTVLGEGALRGSASTVEVDENQVWSDVREFQSALASGMPARALSLYRGDLLPGLFVIGAPSFERWLEDERSRLRLLAAQAAWSLSDQEARMGNGVAAALWGRRAVAIRRDDEASARRLMQRLDVLGDRAGAMSVFEDLVQWLASEYELEPAPETSALAAGIRARQVPPAAHNGRSDQHHGDGGRVAEQSLAVLPFDGDESDTIASGLTDGIVHRLSTLAGLRLVSQGSSALAKAKAEDAFSAAAGLAVGYVLAGSVRRQGPDLEVTARFLDARNHRCLWVEQHTGAQTLLPEVRDALASRIARTLRLSGPCGNGHVAVSSPDEELLRLELNQQARRELARWSPDGFDRAILLANHALDGSGDDEYLLATLGEGHLPHMILGTRPHDCHLQQAERCAERMVALNPESGRGHVLRALVRLRQGNSPGCAEDLRTALSFEPNNPDALFWLSLVYIISGRGHQAKPVVDRLLAVDPMNSTNRCVPGYIQAHSGHFEDAHPHYQTMYRMDPTSPVNRWCYSQLLLRAGRTSEAADMMKSVMAEAPGTALARQGKVFVAALRGDRAAARLAVTDQVRTDARRDEHGSWWLASALAIGGETDEALHWLDNAVRQGYVDEPFLSRIDPCLERLRGTRRFRQVMQRARRAYDTFGE